MRDPETAAAQIRFALEQLSARNGQHEFEHICRRLARARICANILPATGPVAGGGDQGRDFETFLTYLEPLSADSTGFLGLVTNQPVVFACTLQQKGLAAKIRTDVKAILSGGAPPKSIHYFASADIPVARRHSIQEAVQEEFGTYLDIWDGQALAEHLADPDLFWVAIRFLRVPSEVVPKAVASEPDWYDEMLTAWSERDRTPITYAEFSDLRVAARTATFEQPRRAHLDLWIERLEQLAEGTTDPDLARRALYEIAVARLRGLGSWQGHEEEVLALSASTASSNDPSTLTDASVLLMYAQGAVARGLASFEATALLERQRQVIEKATELLAARPSPSTECQILDLRGFAQLFLAMKGEGSFDGVFDDWRRALELSKGAPLYPVLDFGERLDHFLPMIGDHPRYRELTALADDRVRERHGEFKVAERCRDRALAFYRQGHIGRAVDELHEAKVRWFSKEALDGSLLAMLLIAQLYRDLGLNLAAKYYGLAVALQAAHAVDPEHRRFLSRGLLSAAESDYRQGAWIGFMILADLAVRAEFEYGDSTNSPDPQAPINRSLFHAAMAHTTAERVAPSTAERIHEVISSWGFEEVADELYPMGRQVWGSKSIGELRGAFMKEGIGAPFDDLVTTREVRFAALGVTWTVKWRNSREVTAVAEAFIAVLQILLCDLRDVDVALLPTDVRIQLDRGPIDGVSIRQVGGSEGPGWEVVLPRDLGSLANPTQAGLSAHVLPVVIGLISEISLLPIAELKSAIEDRFEAGLLGKTFVADRYDLVFLELTPEQAWASYDTFRNFADHPIGHADPSAHPELEWMRGPTPGFSDVEYEEMVRNRYLRLLPSIRNTLTRLLEDPAFEEVVRRLRSRGWLDWHILHALAVAVANDRIPADVRKINDPDLHKEAMLDHLWTLEAEDAPLPEPRVWSEDHLVMMQSMNMIAILDALGLKLRQRQPDMRAIERFLSERTGYYTIDVYHDDVFAGI